MYFRPIRLSNIRLPIGIMLSRLIIYHDNLADWTFSLLSHMLMSNNSLTTRRIGHYKQLIQQKVQSFQILHSIWTSTCLFTTSASNPPPQLHRILHSTCQSTAQKSSVRMKSGDYTTRFQTVAKRRHLVSWDSWLNANESQRT